MKELTRDSLLEAMVRTANSGYLGLFIGTGFSKAATLERAPSFEELLANLAVRLGLSPDFDGDPRYRRKSLPQIASQLLEDYAAKHPPPERAAEHFREAVSDLCNLLPAEPVAERLRSTLEGIRPSWIITTNYDLILEALIADSISVLPHEPLIARPDRVPVYHLHGHRRSPRSIKVTEEDYVSSLGLVDYQRLKLPLLLLESTTLMLGYSLGDINVRAAMEWSRSFERAQVSGVNGAPGLVIQAVRTEACSGVPTIGPNGEYIIEIADIAEFLEELLARLQQFEEASTRLKASIENFFQRPDTAPATVTSPERREQFLQIVREAQPYIVPGRLVAFLGQALDPIWEKAREDGGFPYYETYLRLLLDVAERIDADHFDPVVIGYVGDALDRVGWYIDPDKSVGSAFGATNTWLIEHGRISEKLKTELDAYARRAPRSGLGQMLHLVKGPEDQSSDGVASGE